MKILLISLLLMSSLNAAEVVKKGDIVKNDGVLFSKAEEKELRKRDQQRIKLEDLNVLKDQKIDIQNKRIDNLKEHVTDLESLNRWGKYTWYLIGFVSATASLYIGSKISKNMK